MAPHCFQNKIQIDSVFHHSSSFIAYSYEAPGNHTTNNSRGSLKPHSWGPQTQQSFCLKPTHKWLTIVYLFSYYMLGSEQDTADALRKKPQLSSSKSRCQKAYFMHFLFLCLFLSALNYLTYYICFTYLSCLLTFSLIRLLIFKERDFNLFSWISRVQNGTWHIIGEEPHKYSWNEFFMKTS